MNRIDRRFEELRAAGRAGLIPFVTAGDPHPDWTVAVMHTLVAAGADVIELGVPFSDPMADGPVIQLASERALAKGVNLTRVLRTVAEFRRTDDHTPVVLMGYLNPIEIHGYERFLREAHLAGVDGLLIVDLPLEESEALQAEFSRCGIAQIFLAAPTTTPERLAKLAERARGFLYYVSFAGITGADRLALDPVRERVAALRAHTRTPIAVGFGVRDVVQAQTIAEFADAVVIGSALVERLAGAPDEAAAVRAAGEFIAPMRHALDGARSRTAA